VLAYIANSMNTKTNEDKLLAIFKQFDYDHDGILTVDEIKGQITISCNPFRPLLTKKLKDPLGTLEN
jgi:Ca2+-binding EF-hand superfamily protein